MWLTLSSPCFYTSLPALALVQLVLTLKKTPSKTRGSRGCLNEAEDTGLEPATPMGQLISNQSASQFAYPPQAILTADFSIRFGSLTRVDGSRQVPDFVSI